MKLKRLIVRCLNQICVALLEPRQPKRNYFRKPDQPCLPETLTECLGETGIISIGDSYRRTHPEWTSEVTTMSPDALMKSFRKRRQFLMDKISADFEKGNLVHVQGWILAQTEGEQCARLSVKPSG